MLNVATVIPDGDSSGSVFTGTALFNDIVERVTVEASFSTTFTADMVVYLISPDGTESELISGNGSGSDFNGTWTFESQAYRGERAAGEWSVRVVDQFGGDTLAVRDIVIRTFGESSVNDRYVFTNEFSDYAGVFGHETAVIDTNGGSDTVNAAAVISGSFIRLDGGMSSIDGIAVTFSNIEHAIGGDGDDRIFGRDTNNELYGMRGQDILKGGDGNDNLYGGSNNDVLLGGAGADVLNGGAGFDRTQYSDATSGVLADLQYANLNTEIAAGDTYVSIERLYGSSFGDNLRGDAAANILWGHNAGDRLIGRDGSDVLHGENGYDNLYGGSGDDKLYGGAHKDLLFGGAGADVLNGGTGIDGLNGGAGGDTFVFQNGFGQDTITDFNISQSGERIALGAVSGITNFADLTNNHLSQSGSNAIIDDGQGNTITLLGVNVGDLLANDFLF